ncbi:hypothetical protein CYMTET_23982 [Cymbomonas tetramitiformis]|uniref:Uncharacterized protein n=1 Tax=Cymbomonas tetramitiformis TaxID=36881 RepID=A0AAE0FWQ0_9CHLO|nr:hypothetical protein CYMTET_23982 [Cymbomonas tetramitiformis]
MGLLMWREVCGVWNFFQYWFFEVLETFRKLIFVAIPVLLDDPRNQLLGSMIVCVVYVACLHCCQPSANWLSRIVKITCAYVLLLNNFYGWMILAAMVNREGNEQELSLSLAIINILAVFGPALVSMYIMYLSLHKLYAQHRVDRSKTHQLGGQKEIDGDIECDMMAGD